MERTVSDKNGNRPPRRFDAGEAHILLTAIDGLPDFLHHRSVDPQSLWRAFGQEEASSRRFDLPRYCALIELAAETMGNDNFGLDLARQATPGRLGLLGDVVLATATLTDALNSLAALFPFYQQNTEANFRQQAGICRFEYRILDGRIRGRRQDAELTMATILGLIRCCVGNSWAPDEVHFEHPQPAGTRTHRRVFNAPVCFSMETNALVFRDPTLTRKMPGAHPQRMRQLREELLRLADGTGTLSLTDKVLGEIRSRLAAGYPHIEDVAESLRLTRWTLQRRLAEQGEVFSELVEATRRGLAEIHLRTPHMPIQDIADVLGYSELSAFTRACVRWFGKPPSRIRAAILKEKAATIGEGSDEMSIASPRAAVVLAARSGGGDAS